MTFRNIIKTGDKVSPMMYAAGNYVSASMLMQWTYIQL